MTSRLKFNHMTDHSGGLNTFQPPTELANNESPDCDNINLTGTSGFDKRKGDSVFNATAMNSAVAVQGMTYFQPTLSTDYMVTVCGDKIYKSGNLNGTMDDITGSLTITSGANYLWTFCKLNSLCIGVGGNNDVPFKWSATGNAAALGGTPPQGSFCFQMRDRVFIGGTAADPSTIYWSVLSNAEDWSGTGSGNNAAITEDGDRLVAGIPLNNNMAILFKQYSIHHLIVDAAPFPIRPLTQSMGACGKNAVVNAEGTIYFINRQPRMMMTDGYSLQPMTVNIDDIWNRVNKDRLEYIQGIYYQKLKQIHWYVSLDESTTNNYCIIWDIARKCWLRNTTGFKCNVACIARGQSLYGGHYDGKIYLKDADGVYADASESGDGAYSGLWTYPWETMGNLMSVKHPRYMDIGFKTQSVGVIKYSYGFNYNPAGQMGSISQVGPGGAWDVDTWDGTFALGGQQNRQRRVYIYGRGNNYQIALYNDIAGQPMQINDATVAFAEVGVKEVAQT